MCNLSHFLVSLETMDQHPQQHEVSRCKKNVYAPQVQGVASSHHGKVEEPGDRSKEGHSVDVETRQGGDHGVPLQGKPKESF